ncbi:hypothetical protein C7S20_07520 [Christiangramia fulva]|uniref:beta-N-acetylhexosaminidase n=1 Tax=Christiangramia fulva TaxID=2126553 RepID=A0A2R3Z4E4_9FLAO|nr:beta-N-acetylhexosaminidase [Christiangramia fulva]AVR45131.1 hypothetical protein C7S20_07520 [Christiangramia fulva]
MSAKISKYAVLILAATFLFSCSGLKKTQEQQSLSKPAIIPLPMKVSWQDGSYTIPKKNIICYNEGSGKTAAWLEKLLKNTGGTVSLTQNDDFSCGNWKIIKDASLKDKLGEEGYMLNIGAQGVVLKGATDAGLFYAVQTLRQFFPPAVEQNDLKKVKVSLRYANIEDKPEYSWRGTMVDVARSFFGLDYLKRHVDRMALYKLNRLHLHLTDDQGWRIEIKSKPKLTEVASKGSVDNGRSGYLTQEEYKELQDYALERNIIVVPEIDMPGHIYSALLAYPELNCAENANIHPKKALPPDLFTGHDVGWSRFCLENPATYDFVSEVVGELASITKGPWIHMGGDEIEDPLYKEFVVKADSIVHHYNKIPVGWEEVTQTKVSPDFISQEWNGKTESVMEDVKVIESICANFYLDHGNTPEQKNTATWCTNGITVEQVYSFSSSNPHVIGVEAPVWSEQVWTDQAMDDRFWPRAAAVAEVAWTPSAKRQFSEFKERLAKHGPRLNEMGIHFFNSPGIDWEKDSGRKKVNGVFYNFKP